MLIYDEYPENDGKSRGKALVGTVSGDSVLFGETFTFDSPVILPATTFDSNSNKIVVTYHNGEPTCHEFLRQNCNENFFIAIGTVVGNNIYFSTPTLIRGSLNYNSIVFDPSADSIVLLYLNHTLDLTPENAPNEERVVD